MHSNRIHASIYTKKTFSLVEWENWIGFPYKNWVVTPARLKMLYASWNVLIFKKNYLYNAYVAYHISLLIINGGQTYTLCHILSSRALSFNIFCASYKANGTWIQKCYFYFL